MKKRTVLLALAVVAVLMALGGGAALAADIQVPGNYATIQAAVNAANDGDTIHVAAGTYEEQVKVEGKSLSLVGAPGATIKSPVRLAGSGPVSANYKAIVSVYRGAATITGFTIDGAGRGNLNSRFVGVLFLDSDGTLADSVVKEVRNTPFSGAQHGVGIVARNTTGVPRTVQILGNTVVGFQKNGMALGAAATAAERNPVLTAIVKDNLVAGAGPTKITAQNGIQVGFGAGGVTTGEVKNNRVRDIAYTGAGWGASGILGYSTSKMVFQRNSVDRAQIALYLWNVAGSQVVNNEAKGPTPGAVSWWGLLLSGGDNRAVNNSFSNMEVGIYVWYADNTKLITNRFAGVEVPTYVEQDTSAGTKQHADKVEP